MSRCWRRTNGYVASSKMVKYIRPCRYFCLSAGSLYIDKSVGNLEVGADVDLRRECLLPFMLILYYFVSGSCSEKEIAEKQYK